MTEEHDNGSDMGRRDGDEADDAADAANVSRILLGVTGW